MKQINTNIVQGYKEKDIPFSLYADENKSSNLAIFLPGGGYSVERPLFHYATKIFLNRSFDILHINYQYNDSFYDDFSNEELAEAVKYDVRTVIDKIFGDSPYENYYLVGKSLGTIAMGTELKRQIFKNAKAVWLTPLLHRDDVFNAMISSENSGLCFIGDNDYCYIEDRYNQLLKNPNILSTLFPKVNHGLEYEDDTPETIEVLKKIMKEMEQF
ncbi:hypothetical protein AN964_01205 [Heyndrickxia shackletonii]|uniref:Alpha/beta hydrolase n=1 Tax=Heyndrickxia shackletonii TaxID=157838 RepID=A0A0Q3TDW1_9BACI|nr:hypothetical protein [Heyndrickxia shackletonii]KQL52296.1 hypothetical protein AN964_01205 [Heyndrickxia shackletonii]NEZ00316.1 alpha/beta hydrolase [Heyndrickxia shackletonii]